MGVLFATSDISSLWAVMTTGEVVTAEWVPTSNSPVTRMYSTATGLCWEAPYSSTSGYDTWTQTSTGPLGADCSSVTSTAWYTRASSLTAGASSTGTGTISSGYVGITHMLHEATLDAVFGAELDGRTLSIHLAKGKPVRGEIYVVSTTDSVDTLVASTEAYDTLESSSNVDPASAGGLTGSSAASLQSSFGSFSTQWERSVSVSVAESYGQVAHRCPSDTSRAYIAIDDEFLSSKPSSSLQRLEAGNTTLQLLVVTGSFFVCAML